MKRLILVTALAGSLGIAPAASANLLANGSFESPLLPGGYEYVGGLSGAITGWTTTLNGVERFDPSVYSVGSAQDGVLAIDLNPYVYFGGGIQQNVATTPGSLYRLEFWAGSSTYAGRDGTGVVNVVAGPAFASFGLTNPSLTISWTKYTVDFTATGSTSSISFFNVTDPFKNFSFVDNASVTLIPEPSTYAMLLAGLGLMGFMARRRVRS